MWLVWSGFTTVAWSQCDDSPDWTVCASGCDRTDIATAVTDASDNDRISVEAGSYPQQIVLTGGKHVCVEAVGTVTVNTGANGEIIRVDNSDLELIGVNIVGNVDRRCIYVSGAGASITFDGVGMSQCNEAADGAGIFLDGGTSAIIVRSELFNNGSTYNGGALYANGGSTVSIIDSDLHNNLGNQGAALWLSGDAAISDSDIHNNDSLDQGGAIFMNNVHLDLFNTNFVGNTSESEGGCLSLFGSSSLDIAGSRFEGCIAQGHGGAVYQASSGAASVSDTTFLANRAESLSNGGGIYVISAASVSITDTRFTRNEAVAGGGLYTSGIGSVTVLRSTFCENESTDGGGAYHGSLGSSSLLSNNLYQWNTSINNGGGLYTTNSSAIVRNNVFLQNVGEDSAGAYVTGGNTTLWSNIFAYHTGIAARKEGSGSVSSAYNNWFENDVDVDGFVKGLGERSDDPQFVGFVDNSSCDDVLTLNSASPLIDAGDPDPAQDDLDGTPNDIGLYGGPNADLDFDNDGSIRPFDCADDDPDVSPSAEEIAGDSVDGNCDGYELCYIDSDLDGYGSAETVSVLGLDCNAPGTSPNADDCYDQAFAIFPGASETPANGIDEDCDLMELCYIDADRDGFGSEVSSPSSLDCSLPGFSLTPDDCDDDDGDQNPDAIELAADGIDGNCDGLETCYEDLDHDDHGTAVLVTDSDLTCTADGSATIADDCDDTDPTVFPGGAEEPGDSIDGDCDSTEICYQDLDGDGQGSFTQLSDALGCDLSGLSATGNDCDDADVDRFSGALERCNGIDDNCDGVLDEGCVDSLEPRSSTVGCSCETAPSSPPFAVLLTFVLCVWRTKRRLWCRAG